MVARPRLLCARTCTYVTAETAHFACVDLRVHQVHAIVVYIIYIFMYRYRRRRVQSHRRALITSYFAYLFVILPFVCPMGHNSN